MAQSEWFLIVPSVGFSLLIWAGLGVALGYFARRPAHRVIIAICLSLRHACRLLGRYATAGARRLRIGSREILLAQLREDRRTALALDFARLRRQMDRELNGIPLLRERLARQLASMEEELDRSAEQPAEPPAWAQVTRSIAEDAGTHTGELARALEDIRDSLAHYRADAREEARRASHRRYVLLYRMMPRWRRVEGVLDSLERRLGRIERRLTRLAWREQELRRSTAGRRRENQVPTLALGALGRFGAATAILGLAVFGGVLWYALLAPAVQTTVGSEALLGALSSASILTGLLLGALLGLGLILAESLGLSAVIPPVGRMDTRQRRMLFWLSFVPMVLLASAAALLYVRIATVGLFGADVLLSPVAIERQLVRAGLFGLMLFALPFVLALSAVALGVLIRSFRPAVALLLAGVLQAAATTLRLVGATLLIVARLGVHLYDLAIFFPLWLEDWSRARRKPSPLEPLPSGTTAESAAGRLARPRPEAVERSVREIG